jgi:hypothetical protein
MRRRKGMSRGKRMNRKRGGEWSERMMMCMRREWFRGEIKGRREGVELRERRERGREDMQRSGRSPVL